MGATVVGKPAARVMTSSPLLHRQSPKRGDVMVENATRLAKAPIHQTTLRDANVRSKLCLKLSRETTTGKPKIETGINQRYDLVFVKDSARIRGGRLPRGKDLVLPSSAGERRNFL